jgi:hypothetical protein
VSERAAAELGRYSGGDSRPRLSGRVKLDSVTGGKPSHYSERSKERTKSDEDEDEGDPENPEEKKSGLKVVTLIATLNPVSQVLW